MQKCLNRNYHRCYAASEGEVKLRNTEKKVIDRTTMPVVIDNLFLFTGVSNVFRLRLCMNS